MNEKKIDAIVLASGGLDSTTLMYYLLDKNVNFIPVFINYGQHCKETEYQRLLEVLPQKCSEKVHIINLSSIYTASNSVLIKEVDLWSQSITNSDMYLPYRNLLFLSAGAAYAQSRKIQKIYAAFINSNHAIEIDCSTDFFNSLSQLLSDYGTIKIELPFKDFSKYEVATLGIKLNAPIAKTFSCQVSSTVPCGACPNCYERLEALKKLHV